MLDASLHLYWVRIPFSSTPRTPFLILRSHSVLIPVYAFSLFLPTIINDLGYQAAQAQLLSAPPYVAGCICTVIIGIISDKYKSRGPFICLSSTVGIIGYSILYGTSSKQPNGAQVFFLPSPLSFKSPVVTCYLCIDLVRRHCHRCLWCVPLYRRRTRLGRWVCRRRHQAWRGARDDDWHGQPRRYLLELHIPDCRQSAVPPRPRDCHRVFDHVVRRVWLVRTREVNLMFLDRFCASCIMMATYRRLNRQKEELCKREGIDQTRRAEFRDIGDASPLFRCAFSCTLLMLYGLNLTTFTAGTRYKPID